MQIEFVKTTTERPFVVFNAIIDTIEHILNYTWNRDTTNSQVIYLKCVVHRVLCLHLLTFDC